MDMHRTAKEIGLFLTAINLVAVMDSPDVQDKVGASMPLPDSDTEKKVSDIAKWLAGFGKRKYMFLTPEIALIEELLRQTDNKAEVTIAIPCDLDPEIKERLQNNLPHGAIVELLEEPHFPAMLYPSNGMLVTCGYMGGDRAMVMADTYRMVEHYNSFLGKKVFIPYIELTSADRYDGWMEVGQDRITEKWRSGHE